MTIRVLDLGRVESFRHIIGQPRNLAWPVAAFRVTLPTVLTSGTSHGNPFEEVVLKLLGLYENISPEALADKTCLPVDMIRNILLRLQDKQDIDSNLRPTAKAQQGFAKSESNVKYSVALVFVEQVSGKVLPQLHLVDDNVPLRTKLLERARIMWRDERFVVPRAPKSRQILQVATKMQHRLEAHRESMYAPLVANRIHVAQEAESFYLDCPIAIRIRDGEFRIGDPFGIGFSVLLEKAFLTRLNEDEKLREWATDFRKSVIARQSVVSVEDDQPFATSRNKRLYPNLIEALRPTRNSKYLKIHQIYSAIEWALYYSCQMFGLEQAVILVRSLSSESYGTWLGEVAEAIGFDLPQEEFRPLWPGKLIDVELGKAELDTLIAVSFAQAENHKNHPIWQLASKHPEFLTRVRELKRSRDSYVHGIEQMDLDNPKLMSEEFMRKVVGILVPAISFTDQSNDVVPTDVKDEVLEARIRLEERVGFEMLQRMPKATLHALLNAEQDLIGLKDEDDFGALILCLCTAIESAIRELPRGHMVAVSSPVSVIQMAQARCFASGIGELPSSIKSANPHRVQAALAGERGSLGAWVIAMIATLDDERFLEFAHSGRESLAAIDALLCKRGHGNNSIYLRRSEANSFVDGATMVVRELLELKR